MILDLTIMIVMIIVLATVGVVTVTLHRIRITRREAANFIRISVASVWNLLFHVAVATLRVSPGRIVVFRLQLARSVHSENIRGNIK